MTDTWDNEGGQVDTENEQLRAELSFIRDRFFMLADIAQQMVDTGKKQEKQLKIARAALGLVSGGRGLDSIAAKTALEMIAEIEETIDVPQDPS